MTKKYNYTKKTGRPTVMTEETLNKLEYVFSLGGTDEEACFYANISHQTLYDYQKLCPEFIDRKNALKQKPILKARETVFNKMSDNFQNAMDYLKRKKKDEFSERQEHTGADGAPLILPSEIINKNDTNSSTENNSK